MIKHISQYSFQGYGIDLCPVNVNDLDFLRESRNDPKISTHMCDQSYITHEQQHQWYDKIKNDLNQAHWTVWYQNIRTGYVNIKGINEYEKLRHVDVGLYAVDTSVRHGLLGISMGLMQLHIVFNVLLFVKIITQVKEDNVTAIRFNKLLGYHEIEKKNGFVDMLITPDSYNLCKKKLIRYFSKDLIYMT